MGPAGLCNKWHQVSVVVQGRNKENTHMRPYTVDVSMKRKKFSRYQCAQCESDVKVVAMKTAVKVSCMPISEVAWAQNWVHFQGLPILNYSTWIAMNVPGPKKSMRHQMMRKMVPCFVNQLDGALASASVKKYTMSIYGGFRGYRTSAKYQKNLWGLLGLELP